MRKVIPIAMLVLLAGTISSCKKIKSWFDVEGDTSLSTNLYIDVMDDAMKSTASTHFYQEAYIDPLDDEDIDKYQENITKIQATNIVAIVTSVNKDNVVFEKGTFIAVKGSDEAKWILDEPWTVTVGDELTLLDDQTAKFYSKVTNMLTNLESLTVIADGYCNQTSVSVTIKVGIDVKYTANPL
ncbi:MAG: hypothetical protein ACWGNV_02015 [Bacteroidales bacterium]